MTHGGRKKSLRVLLTHKRWLQLRISKTRCCLCLSNCRPKMFFVHSMFSARIHCVRGLISMYSPSKWFKLNRKRILRSVCGELIILLFNSVNTDKKSLQANDFRLLPRKRINYRRHLHLGWQYGTSFFRYSSSQCFTFFFFLYGKFDSVGPQRHLCAQFVICAFLFEFAAVD